MIRYCNLSFRKEFDVTVEEYEKKFEEANSEKVARTKENLENLQTLMHELSLIEEQNTGEFTFESDFRHLKIGMHLY